MKGRQGRWHKHLLDDVKETRGYWKLKEEALVRTLWITRFGRGCGTVIKTDYADDDDDVNYLQIFSSSAIFKTSVIYVRLCLSKPVLYDLNDFVFKLTSECTSHMPCILSVAYSSRTTAFILVVRIIVSCSTTSIGFECFRD